MVKLGKEVNLQIICSLFEVVLLKFICFLSYLPAFHCSTAGCKINTRSPNIR